MVVHKAGCLQVRITNGGAEKPKTSFFHILANGVGQRR